MFRQFRFHVLDQLHIRCVLVAVKNHRPQQACEAGNGFPLELVRIPRAIPVFVMMSHHLGHLGIWIFLIVILGVGHQAFTQL